jgi:long-chain acyl-CoA synthetase
MAEAPASPVAILAHAASEAPHAEALVAAGLRFTYADYARAVAGFALQLAALGASGARVALMLGNSAQMAIGIFAVQAAGAALVPLNPEYSVAELEPVLARARPALLVCFADHADRLRQALGPGFEGEILVLPDDPRIWRRSLPDAGDRLPEPDPDALALVQFTGGTTGTPKGVMLTHRALAANVAQREAVLPTVWGDERVLCAMPLFHSFASAMAHLLAANCGGTLVLLPRYRPDLLHHTVLAERITRLPAGPTLLQSLLQWEGFDPQALRTVRSVWSGSAPLPAETQRRWETATAIPVYEGYGQTEAGPVLSFHGPAMALKPMSVGPAVPGTCLEIRDLATGRALGPGETGEIAASGPQLMRGYLDDPDATAAALVEGWLLTGDIGHLDQEGYLFITDRRKDMAIVGGFNVYPREVDEALLRCPGVEAAAAVAVPDAYRGEVIWAWIEGDAGEEALERHCRSTLVRYKRPVRWLKVDALPRTAVGKIDKAELRRRARLELAGDRASGGWDVA